MNETKTGDNPQPRLDDLLVKQRRPEDERLVTRPYVEFTPEEQRKLAEKLGETAYLDPRSTYL